MLGCNGREWWQKASIKHILSAFGHLPEDIDSTLDHPQSKTGLLVGIELDAVDCMQMSKGSGTSNNNEEKLEIEVFS